MICPHCLHKTVHVTWGGPGHYHANERNPLVKKFCDDMHTYCTMLDCSCPKKEQKRKTDWMGFPIQGLVL